VTTTGGTQTKVPHPRAKTAGGGGSRPPENGGKTEAEIGRDAEVLAALLISTPNLRARLFADPTRQAGRSLPPAKSWDYTPPRSGWYPWNWYGSPFRYRKERAQLAKEVLRQVTEQVKGDESQRQGIVASVNTDAVFEDYFAPIVKVSQRNISSVYILSFAAFVAGICLIGVGAYLAIVPRAGTNSTVVASIFGGSGAISALGAVYTMATRGIRGATLDHARVRLVLTAFAAQLGQLRAIIETPPLQRIEDAKKLNDYIGQSMNEALEGIPSPVELAAGGDPAGQARKGDGKSARTVNGKPPKNSVAAP
jgi:hypothetical protein